MSFNRQRVALALGNGDVTPPNQDAITAPGQERTVTTMMAPPKGTEMLRPILEAATNDCLIESILLGAQKK
ncbi:hypothetical protein LB505_014490 [Fusarium chuoi]|nr:hypothetical protein LB505_014490 [Fusarium chuoi]